ncbi:MAG: hypothetical protein P4L46_17980 [Fimbriimonas sp.]|nr:hypothetical protein [Fimbriimonas sp.]
MPSNPPNLEILVKALSAERVRFVVIGGFALVLHGGRNTTMDSDFAIGGDPENVSSIVRGLAHLHPRPWHWHEGVPFVWDERSIFGSNVSLNTTAGDVDLLLHLPGVDSFDGLLRRSVIKQLSGVAFRVASVDDLTAMKRAANRPQDIVHLAELDRIRRASEAD